MNGPTSRKPAVSAIIVPGAGRSSTASSQPIAAKHAP